MSYIAIARRYRPKTFDEVIGQEYIATTLKNAILENKVSHAYIFAGSRGVGKTSMARIFAKALNCKDGPTIKPCSKCESCLRIAEGGDTDVIEMDAASNRGINEVRALIDNVAYTPLRSRYKVYIIDEAHQVTREAFNALLKTLEEPPPHVKFIFATTEVNKLPDTIISRCQRYNFRRIPAQQIYQQVAEVARQEKFKADEMVLKSVARLARGSMRDAESLLDQLISYAGPKLSMKELEMMSGAIDPATIFQLVDAIVQNKPDVIIAIADRIISEGKDVNIFLEQLIEHFWHLILMLVNPDKPDDEIVDDKKLYLAQAMQFKVEMLLDYIRILSEAQKSIRESSMLRLWVEITLLRLLQSGLNKGVAPATIADVELAVRPASKPIPVTVVSDETRTPVMPKPTGDTESSHSVDLLADKDKQSLWTQVVAEVKKASPAKVYPFLKEGQFVEMNQHEVVLGFQKSHNFHRGKLEEIANRKLVEECIEQVTGARLPLSLTVINNNSTAPAVNGAPSVANNSGNATKAADEVSQNETVQDIIRTFEARIVNVEE